VLLAGAAKAPITPGQIGGTSIYPDESPVFLAGYGGWPEPATYTIIKTTLMRMPSEVFGCGESYILI
jgi:hypothetical protein